MDPLAQAKIAESANAAAVSNEATLNAQTAQMEATFVSALTKVLTDETPHGWLLLQRVPIMCNDIRDIKSDLMWIKRIGGGIVLGIGLLALKALGVG
jgi:hypothetical protein